MNISRNTYVIVQQDWIRNKISDLCKIPIQKIIVSYPEFDINSTEDYDGKYKKNQFFYNAFPREFKNFEVICEATNILSSEYFEKSDFDVFLTIDGSENNYSKNIVEKYKANSHLHFIGLISREQCEEYYRNSETLIFPSLLETWGLPISEFKLYKKKMIMADLPYAHEAANGAEKGCFFNPYKPEQLAKIMKSIIIEKDEDLFNKVPKLIICQPFYTTWTSLYKKIITD